MPRHLTLWLLVVAAAACGSDARVSAPAEASAFARFVAVGTGLSMGEQSGGVVYESQIAAWPAQLAARVDAPFRVPALKTPGCAPPLVAPLSIYRTLAGDVGETAASCGGKLGTDTLPANIVAVAGATAWDALHTSPRSFVTQASSLASSRYANVLPALQTQLQAMMAQKPTLVAVELGAGEVMRAVNSGLVTVGTSYTQKTAWTLMPAAVFALVIDSIADSVAATGARAIFVGVPPVMSLPVWRAGDELWQRRAQFASYGLNVAADCQGSANLVNTVAMIPALVAAARTAGIAQPLSCADRPGEADFVLTPADAALITQTVTALNAAIKTAAEKRQFAYVGVPRYWEGGTQGVPTFSAASFLGGDAPFGAGTSLDGIQPSTAGHVTITDVVAVALRTKYGLRIPLSPGYVEAVP